MVCQWLAKMCGRLHTDKYPGRHAVQRQCSAVLLTDGPCHPPAGDPRHGLHLHVLVPLRLVEGLDVAVGHIEGLGHLWGQLGLGQVLQGWGRGV
jgi:hypothetical protein